MCDEVARNPHPVYVAAMKLPAIVLSEDGIRKTNAQLGHCSGNTLGSTIREGRAHVYSSAIQRALEIRGRQAEIQRIAPPSAACCLAKYDGETVDIDIIFPLADCFEEQVANGRHAMFAIDSLSRFVNCSILTNRSSIPAGKVFTNDWVRTIDKPRRIIADRGGPTFPGAAWADMSHAFGRKMIRAPQFPPRQNGLAERSARPLEIAAKRIISATGETCTSQEILTHAAIAQNHVPRAVTGIAPALAMAGRCDILSGYSHAAFSHDPDNSDSLARVGNGAILNARNAIITAESNRAKKP